MKNTYNDNYYYLLKSFQKNKILGEYEEAQHGNNSTIHHVSIILQFYHQSSYILYYHEFIY